MLDTFRTPRNSAVEKNLTKLEPLNLNTDPSFNVLENVYFDKTFQLSRVNANEDFLLAGAEVCKILLHLYHIITLNSNSKNYKKRSIVIGSLTSLLSVSNEAKSYAYVHGLVNISIQQIRELHIKLSLETVECMRRVVSKKRVSPLLKELDSLVGLLTNFMLGHVEIKNRCAEMGLADLIHKLWTWFCFQKVELVNVLKLLCTFTIDSFAGEQNIYLFVLTVVYKMNYFFSMSVVKFYKSSTRFRSKKVTIQRNAATRNCCFNQ